MGRTFTDVATGKPITKQTFKTTKYAWAGKEYPLMHSHNISKVCKTISAMQEGENPRLSYISILLCGQSGSGKTTLAQTMIHRISCNSKEPYIIKWFTGKDLHNLDELIDKLEKGLRYILLFDDVSFVMDFLPSKRKKELAEKLTRIRHDVKGKVITFMNIHYQKALMPMMRDANFRILTSMSDQDSQNWKNTMGWQNRYEIDKFQKQYNYQMKEGYFFINGVTTQERGSYRYDTDKPFRISLCSEGSGVHPLLVPKEGCTRCSPKKAYMSNKKITAEEFYKKCMKGYKSSAITAIRYWAYYNLGDKNVLPKNAKRATAHILENAKMYGYDKEDLIALLRETHS